MTKINWNIIDHELKQELVSDDNRWHISKTQKGEEESKFFLTNYGLLLKQTVTEINALGLKTREWTSVSTGRLHKAKKWDTGTVYRILSNPVYAGYTKHYDVNYEGEHEAIIPRDQW